MRLLLISNMYPSAQNPAYGVFVRNQVEEIQGKHSIDTTLIVSRDSPRTFIGKVRKYSKLFARSLGSWFFPFDILHLHFGSLPNLIAASPAIFKGKPWIVTFHRGDIYDMSHRRLPKAMHSFLVKRARHVIAVSLDIKTKLIEELRVPAERVAVIDVGCDLTVFSPCLPDAKGEAKKRLGIPLDRLVLLFVGTIEHRKGLDVLFRGLRLLQNRSELSLLIVGEGPDRSALESSDSYLEVEERVSWLGRKANRDLPQWYAAADVFVLPSRSEGTPTVLLEAMASGTPILASRVGGIPEVIHDGVNGLLFDPEDARQLQARLATLFDLELRSRLAKEGLRTIVDHSLEKQVGRIVDLYETCLSE